MAREALQGCPERPFRDAVNVKSGLYWRPPELWNKCHGKLHLRSESSSRGLRIADSRSGGSKTLTLDKELERLVFAVLGFSLAFVQYPLTSPILPFGDGNVYCVHLYTGSI